MEGIISGKVALLQTGDTLVCETLQYIITGIFDNFIICEDICPNCKKSHLGEYKINKNKIKLINGKLGF